MGGCGGEADFTTGFGDGGFQPVINCLAGFKLIIGIIIALPRQRPAAGLLAHGARRRADHGNMSARVKRQKAVIIFQHDQRFANRFAANFLVFGLAQSGAVHGGAFGGQTGVKQTGTNFNRQNTRHRFIEARHWHSAVFNLRQQRLINAFPAIGGHIHIDTRQQRVGAIGCGAARNFAMPVPIANHEAVKAHIVAQQISQQTFGAVHFLAIHTRERGHNGLHFIVYGGVIGVGVNFFNVAQRADCVALINAELRAAIADKMLGRGQHALIAQKITLVGRALQALQNRLAQYGY